jgi:hypothetical protein
MSVLCSLQLLLAKCEDEFNVIADLPDFNSHLELSGCRRLPCVS